MSVDTKISLGLHEFFRYAIPGYTYLLILLLPIFLTSSEAKTIKLFLNLDPLVQSTLLIALGPLLGYFLFYLYYPVFKHLHYDYKRIRPFQLIKEYASEMLKIDDPSEYLVRALEDYAVHILPESEFRTVRQRLDFLFSSFHSLGTTVAAIWLAIPSWLLWGLLNYIVSDYSSPFISITKSSLTFAIFGLLSFAVSLVLLRAFRHRKKLGIKEEYILTLLGQVKLKKVIDAYKKAEKKLASDKTKGKCKQKN